jgi:hypothetical protein
MIAATTIGILIIPSLYYIFQNIRDKAHEVKNKRDMKKKDSSNKQDDKNN